MSEKELDTMDTSSTDKIKSDLLAPGTRGSFLRRAGQGGLALAAGGTILAIATACGDDDEPAAATTEEMTTEEMPAPMGDAAVASLAATAELLAIDFYGKGIDTGFFKADVLSYMQAAQQNEQDHYDALADVLGADAPKDLAFTYPDGTLDSAETIATTGAALEEAFVGAYMGAVMSLEDPALKTVAAQIGANEAQHLTILNSLRDGMLVPNPPLPKVLTAEEATMAVTPFLAG